MTSRPGTSPTVVLMACMVALATTIGIAQSDPRDLFERGRLLEENARTLDEAARAYERVVALAKSDRVWI